MKDHSNKSGDRGNRDHSQGSGTKSDRQGGGPGEHNSLAGEMGAKADEPNNSIRSHTQAGEVHGHGTLKEGSSRDQSSEDRFGLHLGDDYRVNRITGEQDENVRRQTGTSNHSGGTVDGSGGGKSSGGAGHGPQSHSHAKSSGRSGNNQPGKSSSSPNASSSTDGNPGNYEGYDGGTPPGKLRSGGDHQHGGEFPPRTRQDPNAMGSSAGSH